MGISAPSKETALRTSLKRLTHSETLSLLKSYVLFKKIIIGYINLIPIKNIIELPNTKIIKAVPKSGCIATSANINKEIIIGVIDLEISKWPLKSRL